MPLERPLCSDEERTFLVMTKLVPGMNQESVPSAVSVSATRLQDSPIAIVDVMANANPMYLVEVH